MRVMTWGRLEAIMIQEPERAQIIVCPSFSLDQQLFCAMK